MAWYPTKVTSSQGYGGVTETITTGGSTKRTQREGSRLDSENHDPVETRTTRRTNSHRSVVTQHTPDFTDTTTRTADQHRVLTAQRAEQHEVEHQEYAHDGFNFVLEIPFRITQPRDRTASNKLVC